MKIYARIEAGAVAELFRTDADVAALFHSGLRWVEVNESVAVGWLEGPSGLTAPSIPDSAPVPAPSLATLQSQIAVLAAQVAALTPR